MSKTIKRAFDEKLTFEKMYEAHYRAKLNKTSKKEVLKFEMDLENNLTNILNNIKNNTYRSGKYREFTIYEPKERIIKALPYRDRVVQQWYVTEFIKPYITKRIIKDTYACIDGRGTHLAVENLQKYMRIMKRKYNDYYILKCDIKGFFYSINKNILFAKLTKFIKDKKLLAFTKLMVFDTETDIGIPIGNYTSQYFANIYLDSFDHYAKEVLRIKYYVRYMDDFIILTETKDEAKRLKEVVNDYITKNLALELNHKSRYYPNKMGVNFCGYRIFETHRLLRTNSKIKIKKNIKIWNEKYKEGTLDVHNANIRWKTWLAHSNHANTYYLQNRMRSRIEFPLDEEENISI